MNGQGKDQGKGQGDGGEAQLRCERHGIPPRTAGAQRRLKCDIPGGAPIWK